MDQWGMFPNSEVAYDLSASMTVEEVKECGIATIAMNLQPWL